MTRHSALYGLLLDDGERAAMSREVAAGVLEDLAALHMEISRRLRTSGADGERGGADGAAIRTDVPSPRQGPPQTLVSISTADFMLIAALRRLLASWPAWRSSAAELLATLNDLAFEEERSRPAWPASGRTLCKELRRLTPVLELLAIGIEFGRRTHGGKRLIIISRRGFKGDPRLNPRASREAAHGALGPGWDTIEGPESPEPAIEGDFLVSSEDGDPGDEAAPVAEGGPDREDEE